MNCKQLSSSWLKKHEGFRVKPYFCTAGKITIGYGHNCEASDTPVTLVRGRITNELAEQLLCEDTDNAIKDARAVVPFFEELAVTRQAVLIDMAFNLGRKRLSKFRNMLANLRDGHYEGTAFEMMDSTWATQVGARANFLAKKMEDGI